MFIKSLNLIFYVLLIYIFSFSQQTNVNKEYPQTQDFCFNIIKPGQGDCPVGEDIKYEMPLLEAIRQRDITEVKKLIKEGADVNQSDNQGRTPILLVARGDLELIDILIEAGADVNSKGIYENSPLMESTGCSKAVKKFLEAGADVNHKNVNKQTAIITAAQNKNLESIKLLIDAGADVYVKDLEEMNAFLYAVKNGSLEIARFFFNKFEKKSFFSDEIAQTALLLALSNSQQEMVEFVLEKGANPNGIGKKIGYPLTYAVQRDNPDLVKLLLKLGADVKAQKGYAIYAASIHGNVEIVKILIQAGADVNIRPNSSWTPLIEATRKNNLELIKLLLKAGAKIDDLDYTGKTALMMACGYEGKLETVRFLIENGANVNIKDEDDNVTALSIARANKKDDIIKLLLENGAID